MFFNSFIENLKLNDKQFCRFFDGNRKEDVSVPALMEDGSLVVFDDDKVECFNLYFKSVLSKDSPHLTTTVTHFPGDTLIP